MAEIKSEREQTAWNIASGQTSLISEFIRQAANSSVDGNHKKAFFGFRAVRNLINCYLEKSEQEKLDEEEKVLFWKCNRWNTLRNNPNLENTKEVFRLDKECAYLINKYFKEIMEMLKEAGYLPLKEDRTRLGF